MEPAVFERQVEQALSTDDPLLTLRGLVQAYREQGVSRAELHDALSDRMLELRRSGNETDEDLLLEVLDLLEGWCSPHMRID